MNESFTVELWNVIAPVLGSLILALVSWGLIELRKWITTKTQNERVTAAFDHVSQAVFVSVYELEQTTRELMSDGKLTGKEKKKLKNRALNSVKKRIGPTVIKEVQKSADDIDDWINAEIEATVFNLKKGGIE